MVVSAGTRAGKPKNELFWGRGVTPSARQTVDQPEAETEPSEPPSGVAAAPPGKPEAGLFGALLLTDAHPCDDDRYPCPVRSQPLAQETAHAPAETADAPPTPSAQPRKRVNNSARPNEKAQAKGEREAPRAPDRAKVSKPAVQEQAADSTSQKSAEAQKPVEATPAVVPSSCVNQMRASIFDTLMRR